MLRSLSRSRRMRRLAMRVNTVTPAPGPARDPPRAEQCGLHGSKSKMPLPAAEDCTVGAKPVGAGTGAGAWRIVPTSGFRLYGSSDRVPWDGGCAVRCCARSTAVSVVVREWNGRRGASRRSAAKLLQLSDAGSGACGCGGGGGAPGGPFKHELGLCGKQTERERHTHRSKGEDKKGCVKTGREQVRGDRFNHSVLHAGNTVNIPSHGSMIAARQDITALHTTQH